VPQNASIDADFDEPADLPEGWANAVLPSVADIVMGQSPPGSTYNEERRGLPFFQGKAEFGPKHPAVCKWCTAPTKIAEPGDVLMSIRAPVGPTNVADRRCAIGRGLAAIRPLAGVPTDLILYAIRLQEAELAEQGTGSTFTAINREHLDNIQLPLPPLAEQKRIVAKVEALLGRVNAARERLRNAPAILKRFRQAVLAAACSGRLAADWRELNAQPDSSLAEGVGDGESDAPATWSITHLRELVASLEQGWSPKCELDASSSPEVWGVIKTTAVQQLRFLEQENKRLPDSLKPREDLEICPGDLLITRAGPRARAGVSCLVRSVRRHLIVCDKVYRFRANETSASPQYLVFALNTPVMIDLIDALKTGTSDSGLNLPQDTFLAIEVPCPPLREQHEIVRRVEALFKLADAIERRVAAGTARADRLTQAILAKAFRGELVPTEAELARREHRDYEPASALLARIRAERANPPTATPRKRRTAKPV
jgi:type I restriction enzyme S subunit